MRLLGEQPISFEVDGQPAHAPMIDARVDGVETCFIVDTGSTDHVWTRHFVGQLDIESLPTEPGIDHAGASTPTWTVGKATVEIADVALTINNVVAIDGPPQFEAWKVGGFLSPQGLSSDYWVVIDFVADRLSLIDADPLSSSTWIDEAFPDLKHLVLERKSRDLLVVDSSLEPQAPVATMLNTGTEETEFAIHAVPHLLGDHDIRGRGASGAEVSGRVVSGQVLRVGETRFKLPALLIREEMPGPPGMIGMDLLKSTVLAISPEPSDPVHWLI
ncbi:MAG: aspartyl protease family protein [Gemmatimonadales bacterium]